jgi:F-type H+-transporting ATPase subunit delta
VREETIARNYAEALFSLAQGHEGIEVFGEGIETVARLIDENSDFRMFLATPRIAASEKKDVIKKVFSGSLPTMLMNFLLITVDKRRQRLLRGISREFHALVDEHRGRVHVEVSVARAIDDATLNALTARLGVMLGKQPVPSVRVKPELLGGVVVRAGDTIYDGSLRRRLSTMRRRLMAAELPS